MSLVDKIVKRVILTNLFGNGWGDQETFLKLLQIRKSTFSPDPGASPPAAAAGPSYEYKPHDLFDLQLTELPKSSSSADAWRTFRGSFVSPIYSVTGLLPPECRICRFELVIPRSWTDSTPASEKRVCLHYAATGDHSFWRRSRLHRSNIVVT